MKILEIVDSIEVPAAFISYPYHPNLISPFRVKDIGGALTWGCARLRLRLTPGYTLSHFVAISLQEFYGAIAPIISGKSYNEKISGSVDSLRALDANESPKRRAFSLGHELFHLLTWESTTQHTPERSCKNSRGEKLANAFAAALLMPRYVVQRKLDTARIRHLSDLVPVALALSVSLPALLWRLVNIGTLERKRVQRFLEPTWGSTDPGWSPPTELDHPLPERYVSLAFTAYMRGDISIGKLSELLETGVGMVEHFLHKYGLDPNADEYQAEVLPA